MKAWGEPAPRRTGTQALDTLGLADLPTRHRRRRHLRRRRGEIAAHRPPLRHAALAGLVGRPGRSGGDEHGQPVARLLQGLHARVGGRPRARARSRRPRGRRRPRIPMPKHRSIRSTGRASPSKAASSRWTAPAPSSTAVASTSNGGTIAAVLTAGAPVPAGFAGRAASSHAAARSTRASSSCTTTSATTSCRCGPCRRTFTNRDQWSGRDDYRIAVTGPMSILGRTAGYIEAIVRYVEAKCLVGRHDHVARHHAQLATPGSSSTTGASSATSSRPATPTCPNADTHVADVARLTPRRSSSGSSLEKRRRCCCTSAKASTPPPAAASRPFGSSRGSGRSRRRWPASTAPG